MSDLERRASSRLRIATSAIVRVRHNAGLPLAITSLSTGGGCMVGTLTVGVGDRVDIMLEIYGDWVEVSGEVVRVDRGVLSDRIAVRFVDVAPEAGEQIREYIADAVQILGLDDIDDAETS